MKIPGFTFFIVFFLNFSSDSFAQADRNIEYYRFYSSIVFNVPFPKHLIENCTPLVCLLKIETDLQMKDYTLTASDNTDSLYKVRLQENIGHFKFESLSKFLRENYAPVKQTTFYIPFAIHKYADPDNCGPPAFRVEHTDKMYTFNGKPIDEIAIFLPPLFITTTTRH